MNYGALNRWILYFLHEKCSSRNLIWANSDSEIKFAEFYFLMRLCETLFTTQLDSCNIDRSLSTFPGTSLFFGPAYFRRICPPYHSYSLSPLHSERLLFGPKHRAVPSSSLVAPLTCIRFTIKRCTAIIWATMVVFQSLISIIRLNALWVHY